MPNIAIIGAGIVGLSTALNIQKTLPYAKVQILADKFSKDTTSYGAGGIFLPTTEEIPGVPEDKLRQWCQGSWDFYSMLALSSKAVETGHEVSHGYIPCMKRKEKPPVYKDIVYGYEELTREQMEKLNFGTYECCYHVTTIITTVSVYLPWLTERFRENGGKIEYRKIHDIQELVGKYDIIVNCTGFGSQRLFSDDKVYATRGQVLRVRAPWIKTWLYPDDGTYILPNRDLVVLGGIRQIGNKDTDANPTDSEDIKEKCLRLCPAIKGYKLDHEWVGLRPSRTPPRLEKEILKFNNGNLKFSMNISGLE